MELIRSYQPQLLIALVLLVLLQFGILMATNSRLTRLSKLMRSLLTGPGGEDLEAMLQRYLSESRRSLERCDELEEELRGLAGHVRNCVQHVGLVRYDAYGDVSGAQSFSLALLDDHHNGAVITGLLGRHDARCFGKPVIGGQAEQALSEEEASALQMALHGGFGSGGSSPAPSNSRRAEREKRERERGMLNRA